MLHQREFCDIANASYCVHIKMRLTGYYASGILSSNCAHVRCIQKHKEFTALHILCPGERKSNRLFSPIRNQA